MPRFKQGNSIGAKGRPKGSGYVKRCTEWADKKGWAQLERLACGMAALTKAEVKKLEKEKETVNNEVPSAV